MSRLQSLLPFHDPDESRVGSSLAAEVQRLRQELEAEREGARCLREALELAASYFCLPVEPGPEADAAWRQIAAAIRSDAGRRAPALDTTRAPAGGKPAADP